MKVTVIFGETRVVVPCGQGDFLVSELIEKAVVRYRKAAGKTADHYVHIHTLKSHSDGGILDLDDLLSDVVDDRDQIIAEYEEHSGPSAPQGGDGTSGSSVGSVSPDAFQSNRKLIPPSSIPVKSGVMSQPAVLPHRSSPSISTNSVRSSPALYIDTTADPRGRHHPPPHPLKPPYLMDRPPVGGDKLPFPSSVGLRAQHDKAPILNNNVDNRHSVEVTEEDLNTGTGLQVLSVRRDSEPNIVSALELEDSLPSVQKPWVHLPEPNPPMKPRHSVRGVSESSGDESGSTSPGFNRFNRDSSRQSLTGQNVLKWASAQERQQESHDQMLPDEPQALQIQTDMQKHGRREPLGQSQSPGEDRTQDTRLVVLKNEDGPLGIHVVPHRDEHNRESGLAIQGVEPGGRVHRTGQIAMRDVIVEINGRSLRHTNFIESQEIFREALQTNEIRLRVHRPAPVRTSSTSSAQDSSAPVSPKGHLLFKSVPPPPPQRSPNTMLSNQSSVASLPRHNQLSPNQVYQQPPDDGEALSSQGVMQASSRKLGKRIYIELSKGPEGLGFSITTRDNPAGGLAPPIYVKNILPKGAAIVDGRLKSGDRLLEVNNTDMTGKSQNEVVAILRNTKRGSTVTLCVSRLDSGDTSSSLPRQMPKVTNEQTAQNSDKKVLTFNIPLNETGSAGLGISVKGKTAMIEGTDKDLGIFIKAVIHGGAASKDGRLQINDQLLSVNGDDLKKKSNSEAMEALRKAMHTEGPTPGHIKLTVERKHNANVSSASTPEPWESSTTSDSTITGRTSTDGGAAVMGNKIAEVTLLQHNERKLSASIEPEQPVISPPDQAVSQNVIDNMRNPVLDRLTGGSNKLSELCTPENESYQIATQEDSDGEESYEPPAYKSQSTIPNPVQSHTNSSSVMMIEGDNNEQMVLQQPIRVEESKPKARPLSTIGGIGMAAAAEAREKRNSELESEKRSVSPQPTGTPSGEESNMNTFDREAMGRRSFSEKRKASNGKNKEVVAKVKALREEMKLGAAPAQPPKEAEPERTGPSLGLKKNSSFESLQAMVEQATKPSAESSVYKPPNRVSRGRGCNESFRAAVDRSYVPALSDQMDPVSEENEFTNMRQAPMNASFSAGETDADKKKNKKTKNSGILGMFRFNKGRKSLEERQTKSPLKLTKSEEKERPSSVSHSSSKSSQQDSDRIQDYYRKLQEKQRTQGADNQQEYGTYPRGDRLRITPPASQPPPVPPHANGNTDRADQLAHIRAQHQRRHNERQGQYPNEDKEDFYERKIKERERDLAVNNRAYGTGAEFNPRHKSSQPSGMSSSALTRYSFYADPRYHDYHRSTQAGGHLPPPNDFNSNVGGQYPLPGGQRTAFTSYNNSLPKRTLPAGSSDYASINKVGSKSDHQMSQSAHQRYPSYDANAPFQAGSAVRHDVIFDYDDPQGAENSLYARVRKAPTLSHAVTNPAQV